MDAGANYSATARNTLPEVERVLQFKAMNMVDKIVMLAEAKGWDQGEVESLVGLSHGRISKWKRDQGEPTARQALRLARLFGVTMEFLADDEQTQPAPAPSSLLPDDERAILDLYRDLEIDKREAVKRLATPLASEARVGEPRWLSERDATKMDIEIERKQIEARKARSVEPKRDDKGVPNGDAPPRGVR